MWAWTHISISITFWGHRHKRKKRKKKEEKEGGRGRRRRKRKTRDKRTDLREIQRIWPNEKLYWWVDIATTMGVPSGSPPPPQPLRRLLCSKEKTDASIRVIEAGL